MEKVKKKKKLQSATANTKRTPIESTNCCYEKKVSERFFFCGRIVAASGVTEKLPVLALIKFTNYYDNSFDIKQ